MEKGLRILEHGYICWVLYICIVQNKNKEVMKNSKKQINVAEVLDFVALVKVVSKISNEFGIAPDNVIFDYELYKEVQISCGFPGSRREIQKIECLGYYFYIELFYARPNAPKSDIFAFVWAA